MHSTANFTFMKNFFFLSIPIFVFLFSAQAQLPDERPKLVVSIIVDQMRADYISRYWDKLGNEGLKKLVIEGRSYNNAHFNYIPTYTGPGHACISTGTTPSINGIIGNNWFERNSTKSVYCVADAQAKKVGANANATSHSPHRLVASTLGDELMLASNGKSKNIALSIKDRSAIFSAGHYASGVYWLDDTTGNFITSTYYAQKLPDWIEQFNKQKLADKYLNETWNTLYPISEYSKWCTDDNVPFEGKLKGTHAPVFPYVLSQIRKHYNYKLIGLVPAGNTITFDLAKAAIKAEQLGKDTNTDLLSISFSTPDIIGHQFGIRSIEVADMYFRFDKEMADFIQFLDAEIGKGNYLLTLTADHGAADNPDFLLSKKIPAGLFNFNIKDSLNTFLKKEFGDEFVTAWMNMQVYLDCEKIENKNLNFYAVVNASKKWLLQHPFVAYAYSQEELLNGNGDLIKQLLRNGIYPKHSGDIAVVIEPGWLEMEWQTTGTTHGTGFTYDTRVPLIWYGWKVKPGIDNRRVHVADIAPTLSLLLNINLPNGAAGNYIHGIVD